MSAKTLPKPSPSPQKHFPRSTRQPYLQRSITENHINYDRQARNGSSSHMPQDRAGNQGKSGEVGMRGKGSLGEAIRFKGQAGRTRLGRIDREFREEVVDRDCKKPEFKPESLYLRTEPVTSSKLKILQKVTDHRRIRSSSKISSKLIELTEFFKQKSISPSRVRLNSQNLTQPSLQTLENILQSKLKISTQTSDTSHLHDLNSYRNTSKTGISNKTGHKSKLSDLMNSNELNNSKQLIKQTEQMRKSSQLRPNPKQWQFHNCLALQKIELYSTNLKISCQGWAVLDHLELKYLRGWNPKLEDDFAPMIRLFIARIFCSLPSIADSSLNPDSIVVRVNDRHIYEDERQKQKEKGLKIRGIPPHTILSMNKLISALLVTKHQDLIVHSVIALGYLLKLIHNTKQSKQPSLQSIRQNQEYYIYVETMDRQLLQQYCKYFEQACVQVCQELELVHTRLCIQFSCLYRDFNRVARAKKLTHAEYTLTSSPLQMSILFMKCLGMPMFSQVLALSSYEAEIRYQVGWNFWETRPYRWRNEELNRYGLRAVGGRNSKGNECYVVWDGERDIVVAMADCKVNMHGKDYERVREWVAKHLGRFTKRYELGKAFCQSDTQKFSKIH